MDFKGGKIMKRVILIITICSILVIGGIITTHIIKNYPNYGTYQNGIFVSRSESGTLL